MSSTWREEPHMSAPRVEMVADVTAPSLHVEPLAFFKATVKETPPSFAEPPAVASTAARESTFDTNQRPSYPGRAFKAEATVSEVASKGRTAVYTAAAGLACGVPSGEYTSLHSPPERGEREPMEAVSYTVTEKRA